MSAKQLDFVHIFEPAQEQGNPRVLLLLHGTGGDEHQMLALGHELAPGAAILSPRGKVLENGNARYFRRLAEGVFDEEDLIFRTNELADFVTQACEHYALDCSRLIAVGYSNGANIAASLMLLRPKVLAGAVLFRPMVPLVPDEKPALTGKQALIAAGESDSMVPVEETRRLSELLESCGTDVSVHWERAGHGLVEGDTQTARRWLESGR